MSDALEIRVTGVRIGIANVKARLPFRFGNTTVWHVAHATVETRIETRDGATATGYAADFLSYAWFDKTPGKPPETGTRELLQAIEGAGEAWTQAGFATAFAHWRDLHPALEQASLARGQNRLSANFGVSMIERGVIDAVGKLTGQSFHEMIRGPVLGIDEPSVFGELTPGSVAAALPATPLQKVLLRHTVGLIDPLTKADNAEPIADGLPETLEDYLAAQDLRSLKVKISGDVDATIDRLIAIAELLKRTGRPIRLTLDGNEQFAELSAFETLIDSIRRTPLLDALWNAVLFIEQPVERTATFETAAAIPSTIGKPMIIDESDGWTTAFAEAMDLGYRGVSHKNCKGVFRSFLNNALAASRNAVLGAPRFFLSAEDLSCLPIVSLNADLAAVANLGITHSERNGHHYFPGLGHLSQAERNGASNYAGLYGTAKGAVALAVRDGAIDTSGLNCPGFGFLGAPDMDRLTPPETWCLDTDQ